MSGAAVDAPSVPAPSFDPDATLSEPAMLTVPLQRPADAFAQSDLRRVTDFRARARDVERAALREEVDAPPEDWRLEAERRARQLARRAGDPERPDRQVPRGRRHAGDAGDERDQ